MPSYGSLGSDRSFDVPVNRQKYQLREKKLQNIDKPEKNYSFDDSEDTGRKCTTGLPSNSISSRNVKSTWSETRQSSFSNYLSKNRRDSSVSNKVVEPYTDLNGCSELNSKTESKTSIISAQQIEGGERHRKEHGDYTRIENDNTNISDENVILQNSSFAFNHISLQDKNVINKSFLSTSEITISSNCVTNRESNQFVQKSNSFTHVSELSKRSNITDGNNHQRSPRVEILKQETFPRRSVISSKFACVHDENNRKLTNFFDRNKNNLDNKGENSNFSFGFDTHVFDNNKKNALFNKAGSTQVNFPVEEIRLRNLIEKNNRNSANLTEVTNVELNSVSSNRLKSILETNQGKTEQLGEITKQINDVNRIRTETNPIIKENTFPVIGKNSTDKVTQQENLKKTKVEPTPRKLSKSKSQSGAFNFLTRGITLPSITPRTSNHSTKSTKGPANNIPSKSVFFSVLSTPLSAELSDYLYYKMKGVHDGILVTACRVAEEEQVLKLIKELSTTGQLDPAFINQCDKTGRVSE